MLKMLLCLNESGTLRLGDIRRGVETVQKRPQKPGTQVQREMKVRKSMARAVEANILQEKERRRGGETAGEVATTAQAETGGQKEGRARAIQAAGATRIKRAKNNTHTHTQSMCVIDRKPLLVPR